MNLGMVLCSSVPNIVLIRISEQSDRASDGSDLISVMSGSRSLVAEIRSEPSDARSNSSEVRNTVLHSTNPKFYFSTSPQITNP